MYKIDKIRVAFLLALLGTLKGAKNCKTETRIPTFFLGRSTFWAELNTLRARKKLPPRREISFDSWDKLISRDSSSKIKVRGFEIRWTTFLDLSLITRRLVTRYRNILKWENIRKEQRRTRSMTPMTFLFRPLRIYSLDNFSRKKKRNSHLPISISCETQDASIVLQKLLLVVPY